MFSNKKTVTLILFILILFSAYWLSTYQRLKQFDTWKANQQIYFVKDYPAMTTLDSFIWLRHAKEYNEGKFIIGEPDKLRYAFDFGGNNEFPIPLLSWLLAKLSVFFNGNYYLAGIYLIPFLAGLFIFPLGIYFYRLKVPAAGILGGLIGTFSFMYYVRSCTGRVDTDSLNLFFPFLASLFILLAFESEKKRNEYIFSSLTGLSMALFYWWYFKPGFTIIFFVTLIVMLLIKDYKSYKTILVSLLLFILFSNPLWFYKGISNLLFQFGRYFSLSDTTNYGNFPNILKTITEGKHVDAQNILKSLLGIYQIAIVGLILFLASIPFKWKKLIPILPVFGLGLLAFKSSNRFAMFLAPFIGIGIGFWINYVWKWLDKPNKIQTFIQHIISYVLIIIIFIVISGYTAYSFIPRPSINASIFSSFIDLKSKVKPNSAVYSWWDFGYAIEDVAGLPTYHDGGNQHTPKTYFIAKGLISPSQKELYNSIRFFEQKGMANIKKQLKNKKNIKEIVNSVFTYQGNSDNASNETVIFFTQDMIGKFGAFSYVGNWNFDKNSSTPTGYRELICSGLRNNILTCNGFTIDLKKGLINNKIPLIKSVFVNNGFVTMEKNYGFSNGYFLEYLSWENGTIILLTDILTFNSNFNQMFLLGRYDYKKFKEVYNNFPTARAFEVLD
jgi:dolichyl-diphosphooligosaccharide--protein glycosyltransferase